MGFPRGAAFSSPDLTLLKTLCMFNPVYPRGKFQTSDSVVFPALAESYILILESYSNYIVRS